MVSFDFMEILLFLLIVIEIMIKILLKYILKRKRNMKLMFFFMIFKDNNLFMVENSI